MDQFYLRTRNQDCFPQPGVIFLYTSRTKLKTPWIREPHSCLLHSWWERHGLFLGYLEMTFEPGDSKTGSGTTFWGCSEKLQGCPTWKVTKFIKALAVEKCFLAWLPQGTPSRPYLQGFASTLVQLSPPLWDPSPCMHHSWKNSYPPLSKVQEICFMVLGYVMDLTERLQGILISFPLNESSNYAGFLYNPVSDTFSHLETTMQFPASHFWEMFNNTSETQEDFVHTNIRSCTMLGQPQNYRNTKIKFSLEELKWKTSWNLKVLAIITLLSSSDGFSIGLCHKQLVQHKSGWAIGQYCYASS